MFSIKGLFLYLQMNPGPQPPQLGFRPGPPPQQNMRAPLPPYRAPPPGDHPVDDGDDDGDDGAADGDDGVDDRCSHDDQRSRLKSILFISIGALFFIFLDNDDEDVDGYGIW